MRKKSLLERIRLFGRSGIDVVAVLGRSSLFLMHALLGRNSTGGGFGLLVKQLHSVGVMSLVIIVVSGTSSAWSWRCKAGQHFVQLWLGAGGRADGCVDAAA